MDDQELRELEDPATWETEGEVRPPVTSPRAVVSVAFARDDLERVTAAARRAGMKTSAFIRQASLEIARPTVSAAIVSVSGGVTTGYPSQRRAGPRIGVTVHTPRPFTFATT